MDATLVASIPSRPRPNRPARLTQPPIKVHQQRTEQRTDLPSPETPKTKFVPSPVPAQNAVVEEEKEKPHTPSTPHTIQTARPSTSPPPPPLTPAGTEDSDTDFQSAYSQSPRGDSDANSIEGVEMDMDDPVNDIVRRSSPVSPSTRNPGLSDMGMVPPSWTTTRTRASSTATTSTAIQRSPVLTENDNIPPPPLPPLSSTIPKTQTKARTNVNHSHHATQ